MRSHSAVETTFWKFDTIGDVKLHTGISTAVAKGMYTFGGGGLGGGGRERELCSKLEITQGGQGRKAA